MILYYCYNNETKKNFVAPNLEDGIIQYPNEYDFVYLIQVTLTEPQIKEMENYGWVEYDILHNKIQTS